MLGARGVGNEAYESPMRRSAVLEGGLYWGPPV